MKIYVDLPKLPRFIDWDEIIKSGHSLVSQSNKADLIIEKNIHNPKNNPDKTIFLIHEPPVEDKYTRQYSPEFRLSFFRVYSIICNTANSRNIVPHPLYFWQPHHDSNNEVKDLQNRTVVFYGRCGKGIIGNEPHIFGNISSLSLYPLRRKIVSDMKQMYPEFHVFGEEWPKEYGVPGAPGRRSENFRKAKVRHIRENKYNFVLCLENAILENYFTEKLWDVYNS
ncbi:MAG: glycosyltransferase family 10, partial [Nanoarchaeota archaeon]